ncbi:MAG: acyl-CoA dehydrogenase family protein [Proteobacteria bacterium]|nr:acyl-CoA dehydrogenase family protein [Pseudomonadota bacterium]
MRQLPGQPAGVAGDGAAFLDAVRLLTPDIEAASAGIDRERRLPEPLVEALLEARLYRMLLPSACAGAELDPMSYLKVIEAVARLDGSLAWCLGQACGSSMIAAYLAPEVARELFGPPRSVLAWGPGAGRAVAVQGGFRVTGRWSFASGGHEATWLGGHCALIEGDGTPRLGPGGVPAIRTMLFPAKRAQWSDIWQVIGLRGTASDAYAVADLFVPEAHTVSREAFAERRDQGALYGLTQIGLYATSFAGVALGIARRMHEDFMALAREKPSFGLRTTLRDGAVVQSRVGHAEATLGAARSYLLGTLEEIWRTLGPGGQATLDQRMRIRLAATFAIHQAVAVADAAFHAAGATAIFADNAFERRFRDIHTVAQQVQGRSEHFETVGQHLLGLAADTALV